MANPTRRDFLAACGALAATPLLRPEEPLISTKDLVYLTALATSTIESATKQASVDKAGFAFVTPGGDYPSFWIRDFSMAAGCGLISTETLRNHVQLAIKVQNGPTERRLGDRAIIPAYAVPDHINYEAGAVFYPGTYSSGDDQGGEPWGVLPPVDDHYEFIHLSYLLWKKSNQVEAFDQLVRALECPAVDPKTQLVTTDAKRRAVGFGFCDGIYFTGSLLFASLLRYRALKEMGDMAVAVGQSAKTVDWNIQRAQLKKNIVLTFENAGWLKAATEIGQQPDVWGTTYALYLGILAPQDAKRIRKTLADAVRRGTITHKGAVRHVPTDHDFSPTSAWEKTAGEGLNRYQNGAYWHVPSGWLAKVLWQEDKLLARQVVREMVAHFQEEQSKGAPWECLHPDGNYRQNPVYMASVTLPLEALSS